MIPPLFWIFFQREKSAPIFFGLLNYPWFDIWQFRGIVHWVLAIISRRRQIISQLSNSRNVEIHSVPQVSAACVLTGPLIVIIRGPFHLLLFGAPISHVI